MHDEHVKPAGELWNKEFQKRSRMNNGLPVSWAIDSTQLCLFLEERIKTGRGIVALIEGDVAGYMVHDNFLFHGAETAFCPIMGHSSVESGRIEIYQSLYKHLSSLWVKDKILEHIITFFCSDTQLKKALYLLGFGLYAVDAYRLNEPVQTDNDVEIFKASLKNVDDIRRLDDEFRTYAKEAPFFLVRKNVTQKYYEEFIKNADAAIFIAKMSSEIIGFMSIRKSNKEDTFTLANENTGKIDKLGAYVKASHRGKGIGTSLLNNVINWCSGQGIDRIHVDYESANLFASSFWPKHFIPTMYSVKRGVNMDIIESERTQKI
jgi:GNAT superfamily N-acetyltransferase